MSSVAASLPAAVSMTETLRPRRDPTRRSRILLLNPAYPLNFWSWTGLESITGKSVLMPNLALATLAALTPTDEFDLTIADENLGAIDFAGDWDLVGMTGYSTQNDRMFAIADDFRRREVLVVIGGPYASLSPGAVRPHADILFLGEAEKTWPAFLDDYLRGRVRVEYAASEEVDLGSSPAPRMDLVANDQYLMGVVQTSRGCPFSCDFCDVIVYLGRRQRHKAPEQVVGELEALYAAGYRSVFLSDDNFTANHRRCESIMVAVAEWSAAKEERVSFCTQLSIDVAAERHALLLDLCVAAGLDFAFVGIETPDEETLLAIHKKQNTNRDLVASVHYLHARGMQVLAGLIVGFDQDDDSVFDRQFDFVQRAGIPFVTVSMLNAPEGTPLEARMAAEGRLTGRMDQLYLETNILPKQMSVDELRDGTKLLLNRLYDPEAFLDRAATLAAHLPDWEVDRRDGVAKDGFEPYGRLRRSYEELGPEFSSIPRRVVRTLMGKNPAHMSFLLTNYYYMVSVLKRWQAWTDQAPAPAS